MCYKSEFYYQKYAKHLLYMPETFLKTSFFGLRCLGLGPAVLASALRFPEPEVEAVTEGEEGTTSLLSSLLAVSELPEPELTPL
jgi:hypothetical protein